MSQFAGMFQPSRLLSFSVRHLKNGQLFRNKLKRQRAFKKCQFSASTPFEPPPHTLWNHSVTFVDNFDSKRHFSTAQEGKERISRLKARENISILDEEAEAIIRQIPLEDVRNFCLIAHIDHGKSSLSSRILELTGNLGPEAQDIAQAAAEGSALMMKRGKDPEQLKDDSKNKLKDSTAGNNQKEQYELFDTLSVEKQRGITIKASTATMLYPHSSAKGPTGVLLLNLIDTPGHVDFGREGMLRTVEFCFISSFVLL